MGKYSYSVINIHHLKGSRQTCVYLLYSNLCIYWTDYGFNYRGINGNMQIAFKTFEQILVRYENANLDHIF